MDSISTYEQKQPRRWSCRCDSSKLKNKDEFTSFTGEILVRRSLEIVLRELGYQVHVVRSDIEFEKAIHPPMITSYWIHGLGLLLVKYISFFSLEFLLSIIYF